MNALENLLIIAGISLDIFAAMECQGSLVAKIDKKQLVKLCALIAAWQIMHRRRLQRLYGGWEFHAVPYQKNRNMVAQ